MSLCSEGAAANLVAAVALEGAVRREGARYVFAPDRPGALVIPCAVPPGRHTLTVNASAVVWGASLTVGDDTFPLPPRPAATNWEVAITVSSPVTALRLWPAEGGAVSLNSIHVRPRASADDGAHVTLGPVSVGLRRNTVDGAPPTTPPGWSGAEIVASDGVVATGGWWRVAEGGSVTLKPRTHGWQRLTARIRAPLGEALWPIAANRAMASDGDHFQGVVKGNGPLVVRPRRFPGEVRVETLSLRPLHPVRVPFAMLRDLLRHRRAWLRGPMGGAVASFGETLARWVPALRAASPRSRAHRRSLGDGALRDDLKTPRQWAEPVGVFVAEGPRQSASLASVEACEGAVLSGPEDATILLRAGDRLLVHAVEALRRAPKGPVVADEDAALWRLPHSPLRHAGVDAAAARHGNPQPLLVRGEGPPVHIPHVLLRRGRPWTPPAPAVIRGQRRVSIITATRDAPQLLDRFLSTLDATQAPFELVLVDHMTSDPAALRHLARAEAAGHTVLRDARPFNFSALNNRGARAASGDILVFANNDLAFTDPDWLGPLAEVGADPEVGCAGAKLLYPRGGVQHAGLVMAGEWGPRHLDRYAPRRARGHAGRLTGVTTVSAVSAALMAVRAEVFHSLGGFDPVFPVRYNDVDLNLRAQEAGFANVLVPQAMAVHHESASLALFRRRERDTVRAAHREADRTLFHARWGHVLARDPFYSPHYDPRSAAFMPCRRNSDG